jgi:hypothetical protein
MNGAEETNQARSGGWSGARWRLGLTIFLLSILAALSRCSPGTTSLTPTAPVEPATGYLRIEVHPQGAQVSIDGLRSGTTPISAELPAGQHTIRVEAAGFQPLIEAVDLAGGEEMVLDGELAPLDGSPGPTVTPTFTPAQPQTPSSTLPDLAVQYVKIELETLGPCMLGATPLGVRAVIANVGQADAAPFAVQINDSQIQVAQGLAAGEQLSLWAPGYASGAENRVVVDATSQIPESDEDNNLFAQMVPIPTPLPTCSPTPAEPATATSRPSPTLTLVPSPTPSPAVTVREAQVAIATYPYAAFLREAQNPVYGMTYPVIDWSAYEASNPVPAAVTYRSLVVENEYLQLTFLPEVGGRLYEVIYKATGHNQTYRNPVFKPTSWGPPEQGWWLAAGGIEWCLPVEEHGYEWGIPWQVSTERDARGVTVILRDTQATDRVHAEIAVRLEAGAAAFTIRPRLENPTGTSLPIKYWTNAMLAPGGRNAPSPDLRFVLPRSVTAVTVHSRGDDSLPGYNERLSWPTFEGRDLSRLGNWNRWLGFFEDPAQGGFMAVYDEGYDEGMIRIFPADVARGAKAFGFGWTDPIPADRWTDDGSSYVEIHGGPAPTFDQSITLPARGSLQWAETWYPVAGLGQLCFANETAALNLRNDGRQVAIGVSVPRAWSGSLVLLLDGQELWRQAIRLQPGQPFRHSVTLGESVPDARLILRLEGPGSQAVAQVSGEDCAPATGND